MTITTDDAMELQYSGKPCSICGHTFTSAKDMLERRPVRSNRPPGDVELACAQCFIQSLLERVGEAEARLDNGLRLLSRASGQSAIAMQTITRALEALRGQKR